MQLTTTFRGLNRAESASANSALERNISRLERLVEKPAPLRAVVEGGPPEHRVTLSLAIDGEDLVAQSSGHELTVIINTACERLRSQLVRLRQRRKTSRQKVASPEAT